MLIICVFILSVIAAVVFQALLPYIYIDYGAASLNKATNSKIKTKLCSDLNIALKITKFEYHLAQLEVYKYESKSAQFGRITDDNYYSCNSSIHQSVYGHVTLSRSNLHRGIKFLRYFILRKNANTYIRSILNHFQIFGEDHQKLTMTVTPRNKNFQLFPNGSISSNDAAINPSYSNSTFSFTFVRDPISRFISGYTEVEYRWFTDPRLSRFNSTVTADLRRPFFQTNSPVGSVQRVKDFIHMLLLSNGSKCASVFNNSAKDFDDATLNHIAPMTSTLIWAKKSSPSHPLRLYKLERFNHEWERLARESSFQSLAKAKASTPLNRHGSSDDPFNTSRAAQLLLLGADAEGVETNIRSSTILSQYQRYFISLSKELYFYLTQYRKADAPSESIIYLRVLCRLYVTDFICAGYNFPVACKDIYDEIPDLILKATF